MYYSAGGIACRYVGMWDQYVSMCWRHCMSISQIGVDTLACQCMHQPQFRGMSGAVESEVPLMMPAVPSTTSVVQSVNGILG